MVGVYLSIGAAERNLCGLTAFLSLTAALVVGMAKKEFIDFGLEEGYEEFLTEFTSYADNSSLQDINLPSVKAFKGVLIILSAVLGVLLTFPSFRFGALASTLLDTKEETSTLLGRLQSLLIHFNLIAPLLVSLLWIKPLAQDHITSQTNLTVGQFYYLRIGLVCAVLIARLATLRLYLACHLDSAAVYMVNLRKEAGRIDHSLVQKKIAYIFQYSSVVVLQIITPVVLMLQFCLLIFSQHNAPEKVEGFRGVFTSNFLASTSSYLLWWCLSLSTVVKLCGTLYYQVSGSA